MTDTRTPSIDQDNATLAALQQHYPALNAPQVSRRALLALGALMGSGLTACGSGSDDAASGSGSGGSSGGAVVTTLAGNSSSGVADGTGTAASFWVLNGVAVDTSGNVYVTDSNRIRMITSAGVVTTLAGAVTSGS